MATSSMVKQDFVRAGVRKNHPINFLVVDDSGLVHKVLHHRFKMLNWTMVSLFNGQEAVKFYQETGFKNVDIVLMDKSMPVMDGLIATTKLIHMGCETPIVALSASPETLDEFVARGALGAITKPLQIPNLVSNLLRVRSLKVEAARQKKASSKTRTEQPCEVTGAGKQTARPVQTREILWGVAERMGNAPAMVIANPNVESWTTDEVCRWLEGLGGAYTMYIPTFRYLGISGRRLLTMQSPDDFDTMGMVGLHRKRILYGVLKLRRHMSKFCEHMTKKQLLSTSSKQKTHPVDKDIVEDILNRYAGNELSDIVVKIVERSLPRLTPESKLKIQSLLNNKKNELNQS